MSGKDCLLRVNRKVACHWRMSRLLALTAPLLLLTVGTANAFQIRNPLKVFRRGTKNSVDIAAPFDIEATKANLLSSISYTKNGKDASSETQLMVSKLVRSIETKATTFDKNKILKEQQQAKLLDGTWFLQYTAPSQLNLTSGDESGDAWVAEDVSEGGKVPEKEYDNRGSVTAAGIKVDTASKETKQIFDVAKSRVTNQVALDWGTVTVGGSYRVSDSVANRAVVSFDQCEIAFNGDGPILYLGFLFSLRALFSGSKESGWLETTFVDEDLRIGRGNGGSLFILTRDPKAVSP